ncbi:hypothetical protein LCGC14_1821010, partial [marine sediment metagenome]
MSIRIGLILAGILLVGSALADSLPASYR